MSPAFVILLLVGCGYSLPVDDLNSQIEVSEYIVEEEDYELTGHRELEGDADGDKRNAINTHTYHTALWTGGIVPYLIHSSYPSSIRHTYETALKEIESDTMVHGRKCVQFVPRTTQTDYVEVVPTHGCHSPVGHHRGRGYVSMGHGCESKGTAMHEFLHVLGFYHEHERYDRDSYVTVHMENLASDVQKDFAKKTTREMNTLGVSYDYGSIMHYRAYAFASDKSKPTIVPKSRSAMIGQRLKLSDKDVKKIQLLYNCGTDLSHIAQPVAQPHKIIDCNFEHTCSHLHQDTSDDFNWEQHSGASHTHGTGPNADHTNAAGNYYLAQARYHHNKEARLTSDTLPAGHVCISFSYFIYGSGVKELSLKAEGNRINHIFKRFTGSQSDQWTTLNINLSVPASFKLIWQASVGSSDLGDIAIDDLSVYSGTCVYQ